MRSQRKPPPNSVPGPIFITGAPRSGTTLCAQILNAHSRVTIFDEVNLLDLCELYQRLDNQADTNTVVSARQSGRALTAVADTITLSPSIATLITPKISKRPLGDLARKSENCEHFVKSLLPNSQRVDIWGEKMPGYTARLRCIKALFPRATVIFTVRHPVALISSYLRYRDALDRTADDFWIANSPKEAIDRLEEVAAQFVENRGYLYALRYEDLESPIGDQ